MESYREDRRPAKHAGFATFAAVGILICVAIAIMFFGPAAFGGFNAVAQLTYGALAVSIVASFALLMLRTKLTAIGRTVLAMLALALVLAAILRFIPAASHLG
jgi:hypothetical protein